MLPNVLIVLVVWIVRMSFVGPAFGILAVASADAKNIANAKYVGRHVIRTNFNV